MISALRSIVTFIERNVYSLAWVFLAMFMASIILGHVPISPWGIRLNDEPGIFAIVTGLLTLFGVIYIILSLIYHFDRILNFRVLLRRSASLINEASKDRDSYICIVCFYPTFGCVTLIKDRVFTRYKEALEQAAIKIPVVVLCAKKEQRDQMIKDLGDVYNKTIEEITEAVLITDEVVDSINASQKKTKKVFEKGRDQKLPDFHLIFSRTRGLFFTPYFVPETSNGRITDLPKSTSPAEIIGLETTDSNILEQFRRTFDFYNQSKDSLDELLKKIGA